MNLKKKLLNFKNMLFNKKFVLLLSFIFILFIFEHKKLNAIDPVVIGKKYQSDFEFNASVLDSLTKLKTEEIYIDKDIRTKIKEKSKIKKSNEKRKIIKETNKIVERKKTYTYINKENLNTLNKVEILFNTNSSNIQNIESDKIKRFIEERKNKKKLFLKITSYAKTKKTGGNDVSRRISLDRAINIRSKLINLGIPPENLIVKALGNVDKTNTKNKVDIEVIKKI